MNSLLQLKGTFEQIPYKSDRAQYKNLPVGKTIKVEQLEKLKKDLVELKTFWINENVFSGALISVYYNKIAAKSNRISALLSKSKITSNSTVVGARFSNDESPKHIITHYVSIEIINKSIEYLEICADELNAKFNGEITHDTINEINIKKLEFNSEKIGKTKFINVLVDAFYVRKFDTLVDNIELNNDSIITIYKTDIEATKIMEKLGINLHFTRIMDDTTILLRPDELALLKQKAPYLISMAVSDLSELTKTDFDFCSDDIMSIPNPKNEPIIGVIDTMFDENVYFSEWVDFVNMLPKELQLSPKDYEHGTSVSSIIVDGPSFNPNMEDGCGRFRVKHFGVATSNQFSSFSILRNINDIISANKNIKVWNLSLGSKLEINQNFISPEAAILDKIQSENDVIFIIAGTNKSSKEPMKAIGAPADSINSLVVNSVNFNKTPTSYTRKGPVLSFFTKPDISYYGGDEKTLMRVYTPTGEAFVKGTSFAAPWIARKLSYLIDILGLSREVAKALIINSATGWDKQKIDSSLVGHGIVPIKIQDIINCPDDEIQFILSGVSEEYDTYNYNIPVPINKNTHPFIVKATLCYFPYCSRNQGVDYTNTELDIKFGRLNGNKIQSINNNYQTDETGHFTWEEDARKFFRKWDNVKHVREISVAGNRPKKVYDRGSWGISLKTKERLGKGYGEGIKFGVIVTLKEIKGVNRIDDFIQNCFLRGWLVNKIDIKKQIDIYNIAEEDIDFDEIL